MSKKTLIFMLFLMFGVNTAVFAAESTPFKSTPYPVPRFVSLNADEVYVRTGPGKQYPISWIFQKEDLPVEIVLEYEHWRKIRDHEGAQGWVYGPLLSGKRTALIKGDQNAPLRERQYETSDIKAYVEPLAIIEVEQCHLHWCEVEAGDYRGWMNKLYIWGVYKNEIFN